MQSVVLRNLYSGFLGKGEDQKIGSYFELFLCFLLYIVYNLYKGEGVKVSKKNCSFGVVL